MHLYLGCRAGSSTGLILLAALSAGYVAIIRGELCNSPVGLSMVTKLAPVKNGRNGVMGIMHLTSAISEFLPGNIGIIMSVPEHLVINPVQSLPYYTGILIRIGPGSAV